MDIEHLLAQEHSRAARLVDRLLRPGRIIDIFAEVVQRGRYA
jgi:hypothetical protein